MMSYWNSKPTFLYFFLSFFTSLCGAFSLFCISLSILYYIIYYIDGRIYVVVINCYIGWKRVCDSVAEKRGKGERERRALHYPLGWAHNLIFGRPRRIRKFKICGLSSLIADKRSSFTPRTLWSVWILLLLVIK